MRHLVVIAGPIGAGKSTVADLLAHRAQRSGMTASVADLDDLAFSQRAQIGVSELWRRAGVAHSALVRGWFDAGVDVVIAHGPFFEAQSYGSLFAAAPAEAVRHHVLLRTTFEIALERVASDPERGLSAMSTQPDFLRETHVAFADRVTSLPPVDIDLDTSASTAAEVADRAFALLHLGP